MSNKVRAFAPASVSNLGCGFDVLGFALDGPGDVVTAQLDTGISSLTIEEICGDNGLLPRDPRENTAGIAVNALLKKTGYTGPGIALRIEKKMPFASGMGSSAASAAAAVMAVNHLLGKPLDQPGLLECVICSETFISGSAHADNAAPALMGGLLLSRSVDPPEVLNLPVPENLFYTLLHPWVEVKTREAREALPQSVSLKIAVKQSAHLGALVHALHCVDLGLLARSMQDFIAEPVRSVNIPHFEFIKKTALQNGALTFNISGSGPSVFSFCPSKSASEKVASALRDVCKIKGIKNEIWSGTIRRTGAEILPE